MTVKEYLINEFGFTESKAEDILRVSRMTDIELVKSKLKEISHFLNLNVNELKKTISSWPQTLNISVENVKGKAEFYKKEYGMTLPQFRKMVKINFAPIHASTKKVKELEDYYYVAWGMSKEQFVAKMKRVPGFVGMTPESVDKRTREIGLQYGMSHGDLEKLVKSGTNFPCVALDKIYEMADFFEREFFIDGDTFGKMLVSGKPISYTKEKITENYEYLKKRFALSKLQYGTMIQRCPTVLGFSSKTLEGRIAKLQELGLDLDTIVDRARTLTVNQSKMKARYMYAKLNGCTEDKFLSNGFMYDIKNVHARTVYVKNENLPMSYIYLPEKKFAMRTGVKTAEIISENFNMNDLYEYLQSQYNASFEDGVTLAEEDMVND